LTGKIKARRFAVIRRFVALFDFRKKITPANTTGVADSSASEMYEQCLSVTEKNFLAKRKTPNRGRRIKINHALRINALRIEKNLLPVARRSNGDC